MEPFVIKRKLENTRKFVELVVNENPPPENNQLEYELYAICTGFKEYDLDSFNVGDNILQNPIIAINSLALKINLAWVKNNIIEKIKETIYTLRNDKWMNSEGEYVDKMIPDTNNEGEFIENPEAILTECDYWLNLMVNVDVNDRYLIEQGFLRLDLVQHKWANEAL